MQSIELGMNDMVPEFDKSELPNVDATLSPLGPALLLPLARSASDSRLQPLVAAKNPEDGFEMRQDTSPEEKPGLIP